MPGPEAGAAGGLGPARCIDLDHLDEFAQFDVLKSGQIWIAGVEMYGGDIAPAGTPGGEWSGVPRRRRRAREAGRRSVDERAVNLQVNIARPGPGNPGPEVGAIRSSADGI